MEGAAQPRIIDLDDGRLRDIQNEILELIARGGSLDLVAERLCTRIEDVAPEAICSVLAVDAEHRLRHVAAPQLPSHFLEAIDGLAIGPDVGSCGTAAHFGETVLVTSIAKDPLWRKFAALALPLGLQACWSTPIKSASGRVVGTFAFYYRTQRGPSATEMRIVATCVNLCAIAFDQREIQQRNHRLAYYDTLTGLPNRCHADMVLNDRMQENPDGLGLLLIDIDNLKITNDTMGHLAGDALIREVASRIAACVEPDIACRIGGDEFIVVLGTCGDDPALAEVAERVLAAMKPPLVRDGQTVALHVTIGGVRYGRDGRTIDTLRQNADFALYHAKESSRGHYVKFNDNLRTTIMRRVQSVQEFESALAEDRIIAHYQPIVRIDTGEIVGVEALARLVTPDGRVRSVWDFRSALTEAHLAYRLTDHMLAQVASDVRSWLDCGIAFQHVGVNVTTADFQKDDLAARITAAFGRRNVPLRHVVLEVTESVFVGGSDNMVARSVERLRAEGLLVALDDFGTGFASLTHLLTFPVDIMKIDKSFIDRIVSDASSDVIVSALIDIASRLNMRIVAEGIETRDQGDRLLSMGCKLGQGYAFYRPADADETRRRLLANAQELTRQSRKVA